MLVIDIAVEDGNGRREVGQIALVRGKPHPKLKRAYSYHYRARIDNTEYLGSVLHSFDMGAVALAQKATKAIVAQQKAVKHA